MSKLKLKNKNLFDLYDYILPQNLVAKKPAIPRDNSKLFVYISKTDKIIFDRFYNLDKFLPEKSFLVLNDTKVLPARVTLKKETGGKVVCLLLTNELAGLKDKNNIRALADRKIRVGDKLYLDANHYFTVIKQERKIFWLKFLFGQDVLLTKIVEIGKTPVPLYLRKTPLSENQLRKKYQTVFADSTGSVAAPTASLHFTKRLFEKLEKKEILRFYITLHVGLGTFAPISAENIKNKKLHEEFVAIDKKVVNQIIALKQKGYKLVAAGTTTVRTLESVTVSNPQGSGNPEGYISGKTDLFIMPPYDFRLVDILLTNFHLPKSSLMLLVEAFLQYKKAKRHLWELYNVAIKNNFRFYSFGDAMLIL